MHFIDYKLDELKTKLIELYNRTGDLNFPTGIFDEFDFSIRQKISYTDEHDTVPVYNPFYQQYIDIDIDIAPLVKRIWKRGWKTNNSCQNNNPKGYVWIEFDNSLDVKDFLKTVFQGTNDTHDISERALLSYDYLPNAWIYKVLPFPEIKNDSSDNDSTDSDVITDVSVSVSIRFPITDLDFVYQRIK